MQLEKHVVLFMMTLEGREISAEVLELNTIFRRDSEDLPEVRF